MYWITIYLGAAANARSIRKSTASNQARLRFKFRGGRSRIVVSGCIKS
jgi:hypothetical protein